MPIYNLECGMCGHPIGEVFASFHIEIGETDYIDGVFCPKCKSSKLIRPGVELTARQAKQWEAAKSGKHRTMVRGDDTYKTPVKE